MSSRKTGAFMAGSFVSSLLSAVCYMQSWAAALERYSHSNQVAAWMWCAVLLGLVSIGCAIVALVAIGETIDLRHAMMCDELERRKQGAKGLVD